VQSLEDLSLMFPTKFLFIGPSGFREDVLEINQSETRINCTCGGYVYLRVGTKCTPYFYIIRIVCHWIIYVYMYALMIRLFVYRVFVSCIVRFSFRSCEAFVSSFRLRFRLFAFGAYCKLIRSRICTSISNF